MPNCVSTKGEKTFGGTQSWVRKQVWVNTLPWVAACQVQGNLNYRAVCCALEKRSLDTVHPQRERCIPQCIPYQRLSEGSAFLWTERRRKDQLWPPGHCWEGKKSFSINSLDGTVWKEPKVWGCPWLSALPSEFWADLRLTVKREKSWLSGL